MNFLLDNYNQDVSSSKLRQCGHTELKFLSSDVNTLRDCIVDRTVAV